MLTLAADRQELALAPELGGAVAAWRFRDARGATVPLLRAWDGRARDLYTTACFPLVPWSNRITGGGFEAAPGFVALAPNREGEPYPIHGTAWLHPWHVLEHRPDHAVLEVDRSDDPGPWRYRATERFQLKPDGLTVALAATHLGEQPMPYGLGIHPYFPRSRETRLAAATTGVWMSRPDRTPTHHVRPTPEAWDFRGGRTLGDDGTIDHGFTGWDGEARIEWPEHRLGLVMRARTEFLQLYRPEGGDYFCLEPVSHPIDAFHLEGRPGLVELAQGETTELVVDFTLVALAR